MDKAKQRMQARRAKAKAATDALDEDEDDEEDAAAEEKAEDSEDEGALARAEEAVAAAPPASKLPPPRELYDFEPNSTDARLIPPKLGKVRARVRV